MNKEATQVLLPMPKTSLYHTKGKEEKADKRWRVKSTCIGGWGGMSWGRGYTIISIIVSLVYKTGSFVENKVLISNILFLLISNVSMLTFIYASLLMRYLYNNEYLLESIWVYFQVHGLLAQVFLPVVQTTLASPPVCTRLSCLTKCGDRVSNITFFLRLY